MSEWRRSPPPEPTRDRLGANLPLVAVGILLLWLAIPMVAMMEMGDCFQPADVCEAANPSRLHAFLTIGTLLGMTCLGLVSAVIPGRWLPIAVVVASVVVLLAACLSLSRDTKPPAIPNGMFFLVPGAAWLAVVSAREALARRQRG